MIINRLNSISVEALKKLNWLQAQLKPLMDQLSRVKDLPVPEFGSLLAWEARASAMGRAANGDISGDSKMSQLGYNGAAMPYSGDTKVRGSYFKGYHFLHVNKLCNI